MESHLKTALTTWQDTVLQFVSQLAMSYPMYRDIFQPIQLAGLELASGADLLLAGIGAAQSGATDMIHVSLVYLVICTWDLAISGPGGLACKQTHVKLSSLLDVESCLCVQYIRSQCTGNRHSNIYRSQKHPELHTSILCTVCAGLARDNSLPIQI